TLLSYRIEYTEGKNMLPAAVALIAVVILELAGHFTLVNTPYASLYNYPRFIDRSIREFGLSRFLIQDFRSIHSDETTLLVPESSADPVESTESPESAESEDTRRNHISDASWEEIMNADDNADRKKIDQYLMSRTMTEYNDHTGMFQDYNVVYVMIEAFDYMAIDPQLTPTLYKMKEEGWDFTHHYTPKFSCATGESEFVSEISLVPMSDVCTPNQWAANDWQNSIFNLFEHAGYYTSAYHNWIDEYYDRRILYSHSGCEAYLNYDDLNYTRLWGWQSDLEMMELTIPYWINQDRFFSLYVTTSTHFPYDQGSELGNRYLNEVSAVHPDYPLLVQRYISKAIELDKSMEYLLKQLEDAGKLDHTLIVLFADHHPLETPLQILADYGGQEADRLNGFDEDRTPMIFYTPSMTPTKQDRINSTFDILPTVANLIGLDYEPRIYVGHDYFDPESKLVIFPNGSWITENGSYYASDDTHDDTLSEEEIESRNLEVQNLFTISRMIYDSDYFHFRPTVPFPGER
ncbi:MAG: LTA synthase family protein, partial [Solobacterium sp.]|nr:LTA synthase family protein [Solobacterium sp.]